MAPDARTKDMFGDSSRIVAQPSARHINHGVNEPGLHEIAAVRGLYYAPGFLDDKAQHGAAEHIDANAWRPDLGRRVQHYGWRYDYKARTVTPDMYLGPLPGWIRGIARRLCDETGLFDRVPEQVIVNEYHPGQGIALHSDKDCFGAVVATISLGDDWEMKFRPREGRAEEDKFIMLQRGSALILTGAARFCWMHAIDKRKAEKDGSRQRARRRRLSLTFRTVVNR